MMTDSPKSTRNNKVVGTRPPRHDGVEKVIGKAVFGKNSDNLSKSRSIFTKLSECA